MNAAVPMAPSEREHLCDQVLHANTPAEVRAAWKALRAWLESHPEDEGLRPGFGMLYRLAECNGMIPTGEVMFSLEEPATAEAA